MGSHSWLEACPACGFQYLQCYAGNEEWSVSCPACGYARWTEGHDPTPEEVELVKKKLAEMTDDEMMDLVSGYEVDGISLVLKEEVNDGKP